MRSATINGSAGFLLDQAPDWDAPFRADFELTATAEESLTARELRRPVATRLRCRLSFSILSHGVESRRLAAGLSAYQKQPVAVPVWPLASKYSSVVPPAIVSGLTLVFSDNWANWEILATGSAMPFWVTGHSNLCPLLVGRLERRELRWLNPALCVFAVSFVENSPASLALSLGEQEFPAGPAPSDAYTVAPRMFPLAIDYDSPSASWSVNVERATLGFGREALEVLYPQANAAAQESQYLAEGAQVLTLLRFFAQHATGRAFWAVENGNAAVLAGDLSEVSMAAAVDSTEGLEPGDRLAFLTDSGPLPVRVESLGPAAIFFESAPGAVPEGTVLARLRLVRFTRPRLSLSWLTGSLAACSLSFRELPPEYVPAPGEVLGVTLGLSWHRVFLYEITAGSTVERWTSHETDVEMEGDVWTAAQIEHGDIARGLALDRDRVTVTVALGASPLLKALALRQSAAPVRVRIIEASVTRIPQFGEEFGEDFQ